MSFSATKPTVVADPTLLAQLGLLEIPDCGCRSDECICGKPPGINGVPECSCFGPPCEHVLAKTHSIPLDEWAADLADADPASYVGPSELPPPRKAKKKKNRIAIYRGRSAAGLCLYHPADSWNQTHLADPNTRVGIRVAKAANGVIVEETLFLPAASTSTDPAPAAYPHLERDDPESRAARALYESVFGPSVTGAASVFPATTSTRAAI